MLEAYSDLIEAQSDLIEKCASSGIHETGEILSHV